jgi:phage-related protein
VYGKNIVGIETCSNIVYGKNIVGIETCQLAGQ